MAADSHLSAPPEEMRIGNIIKDIEPDLDLVQCFSILSEILVPLLTTVSLRV